MQPMPQTTRLQGGDVATTLDEAVTEAVQEAVAGVLAAPTTVPAPAPAAAASQPQQQMGDDRRHLDYTASAAAATAAAAAAAAATAEAAGPDVLLVVNHLEELADVWQWVADNVTKKGERSVWSHGVDSLAQLCDEANCACCRLRRRESVAKPFGSKRTIQSAVHSQSNNAPPHLLHLTYFLPSPPSPPQPARGT